MLWRRPFIHDVLLEMGKIALIINDQKIDLSLVAYLDIVSYLQSGVVGELL